MEIGSLCHSMRGGGEGKGVEGDGAGGGERTGLVRQINPKSVKKTQSFSPYAQKKSYCSM